MNTPFTILPLCETGLEFRFGDKMDIRLSNTIISLFHSLQQKLDKQEWKITDILPTYTTLAIHFTPDSPLFIDPHALDTMIFEALNAPLEHQSQKHIITVSYTGEDIPYLCQELLLSQEELIELHTQNIYPISMLGFRPYFPYLLGLDPRLHISRRHSPRLKVPKGAVAIGGEQTGIYSQASPGGWHIIGYTDFDAYETLQPGDTIQFIKKDNYAH